MSPDPKDDEERQAIESGDHDPLTDEERKELYGVDRDVL